jgi:multiple sugar transport system permease protein
MTRSGHPAIEKGGDPVPRFPSLSRLRWEEARWAYLFLLPNLALFLIFTIYPVFASFYYSLNNWTLHSPMQFIGLANYQNLVSDPIFRQVMGNTLYYTAGVIPLQTALALLIAVGLNQNIRFMTGYRALYFVPVVSGVGLNSKSRKDARAL